MKKEIAFKTLAKYCKSCEHYHWETGGKSGNQNICNDGRNYGVCCQKYCG